MTACVCEMNNCLRGNTNWPVVYGVGVNVKNSELFPATFHDRSPAISLRSTRMYTGLQEMIDIYDTQLGLVKIGPFNYKPMRGVELWLTQPDAVILQVSQLCVLLECVLTLYCPASLHFSGS